MGIVARTRRSHAVGCGPGQTNLVADPSALSDCLLPPVVPRVPTHRQTERLVHVYVPPDTHSLCDTTGDLSAGSRPARSLARRKKDLASLGSRYEHVQSCESRVG